MDKILQGKALSMEFKKHRLQLTIILILLVLIVTMLFLFVHLLLPGGDDIEQPAAYQQQVQKKPSTVKKETMTELSPAQIRNDLSLKTDVVIDNQYNEASWYVVRISPIDGSFGKAVIIYERDKKEFIRRAGPGTSFSNNELFAVGVPEGIKKSFLKDYISTRE